MKKTAKKQARRAFGDRIPAGDLFVPPKLAQVAALLPQEERPKIYPHRSDSHKSEFNLPRCNVREEGIYPPSNPPPKA